MEMTSLLSVMSRNVLLLPDAIYLHHFKYDIPHQINSLFPAAPLLLPFKIIQLNFSQASFIFAAYVINSAVFIRLISF